MECEPISSPFVTLKRPSPPGYQQRIRISPYRSFLSGRTRVSANRRRRHPPHLRLSSIFAPTADRRRLRLDEGTGSLRLAWRHLQHPRVDANPASPFKIAPHFVRSLDPPLSQAAAIACETGTAMLLCISTCPVDR